MPKEPRGAEIKHYLDMVGVREALAEFRRADAELWKVIREQPSGDAGRAQFEAALAAAVEAGNRLAKARALQ